MTRRKDRTPYESVDYKEVWLFGDEAREWIRSHDPSGFGGEFSKRRTVRAYQAMRRVDDGWGIVVSWWKSRPDDQNCSRVICPKCKHEMRLNQSIWAMRHERRCGLPTRTVIAGALAEAFNLFSAPGRSVYEVMLEKRAAEAAKESG